MKTQAGLPGKALAGAFALAMLAALPSWADTILSEDFSSGSPAGWSVTNGYAFVATSSFDAGLGSSNALALDYVDYSLQPPRWTQGSTVVTTPLSVVAGTTYTVSWDVATFYTNGGDGPEGAVRRPQLLFDAPGFSTLGNPTLNVNAQFWAGTDSTAVFTNQTYTLTPSAPILTLSIVDNTSYPINIGGFMMVRDVVITGQAPPSGTLEPAAWALMLGGFATVVIFRRRFAGPAGR